MHDPFIPVLQKLFLVAVCTVSLAAAQAQEPAFHAQHGVYSSCVLVAEHPEMRFADPNAQPVQSAYDPSLPQTATFEVTYNGFTPEAEAAFQRAVDIWSQHISAPDTIRIAASFGVLGPNILGSAGSVGIFRFNNSPFPNTWYPNALADALSGTDLDIGSNDSEINATFNSTFTNWYFGLDANPPPGTFDFVMVVLHEIGHGLGFFGSARIDDGINTPPSNVQECRNVDDEGCWGFSTGFPIVYDRFVQDSDSVSILNTTVYPNPSIDLGDAYKSGDLFIDASTVTLAVGDRAQIYAPTTWNAGSSYSHWDEAAFAPSSENALMTPFVSPGEAVHSPGPATCALFRDMGWELGAECDALVPVGTEPLTDRRAQEGYALSAVAPNPFGDRARFSLEVGAPQHIRATLYDVLGRVVAELYDGGAAPGELLTLSIEGHALAPAVYIMRIEGEHFAVTRQVVRAR